MIFMEILRNQYKKYRHFFFFLRKTTSIKKKNNCLHRPEELVITSYKLFTTN